MDGDGNDADSLAKAAPSPLSQSTPVKVKRKRRSIDITTSAPRQARHANGSTRAGESVQKQIIKGEDKGHDGPTNGSKAQIMPPTQPPTLSGVPLPRRKMKVNRRTDPVHSADSRLPFSTSSGAPAMRTADDTPLTPEELERAKSIVLDLLGWGVPPEYLIERGVSSHAIYHIFTELQLRLPSNLSSPY